MKGMYSMEWYQWLSETDQEKFEDRLIRWTKECGKMAFMIFDKSILTVGMTMRIESIDSFYLVKLPRITVEYICINGDMCILRRVILKGENSEEVLYKIPDSWDGTTPWYAY